MSRPIFGNLGARLRVVCFLQRRRQWLQRIWEQHKPPCVHCRDVDRLFSKHLRDAQEAIVHGSGWDLSGFIIPQQIRCTWCRRGPIDMTDQLTKFLDKKGAANDVQLRDPGR